MASFPPAGPDTTVLLLGSGGREHAIAWKLAQSPRLKNLYALPGSDALAQWAQCLPGDPCDPAAVVGAAKKAHAKLVFVGPEAPLAAGVADALRKEGVATFGPGKDAARLESSKAFAKDFMRRHGLPTARYEVHDDAAEARAAALAWRGGLVVKADGLAAGQGVFVCDSGAQAAAAVDEVMAARTLGAAGARVVLEERLEGPEVSILGLLDGKRYKLLPASQDHKRLKDGDAGPNTGGMGAYAPAALGGDLLGRVGEDVFARALRGLAADGLDYRGVLYAGLMLTQDGPKLLEFNCRFGDPETQAILPVLETDLLQLALECAEGSLTTTPKAARKGCVGVVLASEGYPAKPAVGRPIEGLDTASAGDVLVFHAGTKKEKGRWLTAGGRVLTVCGVDRDISKAREKAYSALRGIRFSGMQYRRDIAAKELVAA